MSLDKSESQKLLISPRLRVHALENRETRKELTEHFMVPGEGDSSGLQLSGKSAIAVMHSVYLGDARPRRAAEALVEAGMKIEVICLRQTDEEPERESFNGVDITRLDLRHRLGGGSIIFFGIAQ